MIKIMFICHGNICRSPMAEFVFRDMITKKGLSKDISVASSATSREEIGNPVHSGTTKKLKPLGISTFGKTAIQFKADDYPCYDYLIVMDQQNLNNLQKIINEDTHQKVYRLLDFSNRSGDIADPWYTGNFDETYEDILEGCQGLLHHIQTNHL